MQSTLHVEAASDPRQITRAKFYASGAERVVDIQVARGHRRNKRGREDVRLGACVRVVVTTGKVRGFAGTAWGKPRSWTYETEEQALSAAADTALRALSWIGGAS